MNKILILGAGHEESLREICRVHGAGEIRVLGGDEFVTAREVFLHEIFPWVLEHRPLVVTDSATWKGSPELLGQVFAHLTGRSAEAVQYFLFEMGVEIKSVSLTQGLLSLKDLLKVLGQVELSEGQRLRLQVLGELIL